MLLSIVKCGDYKIKSQHGQVVQKKTLGVGIEVIGPVYNSSATKMRNRGSKQAIGQWLLFVDNDCDVSAQNVLSVVKEIEKLDLPIVAVGGAYCDQSDSIVSRAYGGIQKKWIVRGRGKQITPKIFLANHLLGGALLVRKKEFDAIGGFDNDIGWGGEELDLVQRLQTEGYETCVSYDLQVQHDKSLSLLGLVKRAWYQNFNRGHFSLSSKSPVSTKLYFVTPVIVLLPTMLFFSVSFLAFYLGLFTRSLRG